MEGAPNPVLPPPNPAPVEIVGAPPKPVEAPVGAPNPVGAALVPPNPPVAGAPKVVPPPIPNPVLLGAPKPVEAPVPKPPVEAPNLVACGAGSNELVVPPNVDPMVGAGAAPNEVAPPNVGPPPKPPPPPKVVAGLPNCSVARDRERIGEERVLVSML